MSQLVFGGMAKGHELLQYLLHRVGILSPSLLPRAHTRGKVIGLSVCLSVVTTKIARS